MKKIILKVTFSYFLFCYNSHAQVGINTTNPQATLDVRELNPASPTSNAGIAIPQVNVLPSSGNRAGQLVFLTSDLSFYYYNGANWTKVDTKNVAIPEWYPNSSGVNYTINAIINFSGNLYKNTTGINTDSNPSLDTTNWIKVASGSSSNSSLGWAQYSDGQYSSSSPLSILEGNDAVLNIDGASTIKSQLPIGVVDLYDVATSRIIPVNSGDGFAFTLSFNAISNNLQGAATISIDIGGTQGKIFKRIFTFPKGAGVEHPFLFSTQGYQLGTFKANGGLIKVDANIGDIQIYNISLQIHKTHDAR